MRWIVNALCAVSLVLCILVLIIWIRSYFKGAYYSFDVQPSQLQLVKGDVQVRPVHRSKVISAENGRIVVSDVTSAPHVLFGHITYSIRLLPILVGLLVP